MLHRGERCLVLLNAFPYKPRCLGVNEGKIAGAGCAGHAHLQVGPRWAAGSNFVARRTRVCCHSRCRTPTRGCASGSPEFRRRIWRGVAPVLHSHHRS